MDFNFDYSNLIEVMRDNMIDYSEPVTARLKRTGLNLKEVLTLKDNCVIKTKFNNPLLELYNKIQLSKSVLGTAVQTYIDIKFSVFEVFNLVELFYSEEYNEIKHLLKSNNENDLITFCVLYANLVNQSRILTYEFMEIDLKLIDNNVREYITKAYENTIKFLKNYSLKIEYSEVGFQLFHQFKIGYSRCYGDLDYITNKGILDLKCVKNPLKAVNLCQQLAYLVMGKYGKNDKNISKELFENMSNVMCYNPLLDELIAVDLNKFNKEALFLTKLFNECY